MASASETQIKTPIKVKYSKSGQKPVQFYVKKALKDLQQEIPNATIIKHTEYRNFSDFLRACYKKFIYYLLIQEEKSEKIPPYDKKKIEIRSQLKIIPKKDLVNELIPFLAGI
ncbi:MAG: hypothetical protein EAX96_06610 [Candidatus Lokiarchaeota archaeon]|nr:hypothetical protein [Candidatus Lokiarchaeota archaeon]